MRKVLIAALFAALALGPFCGPALASGNLTKQEKAQMFMKGAELWPVYCSQCHNARPPSQKAPYEWDQIMMHMRTLSNMPAPDARALLEYLKGGR